MKLINALFSWNNEIIELLGKEIGRNQTTCKNAKIEYFTCYQG